MRYSEPTVDAAAKALSRFESYTNYMDFKVFHRSQAIAFKKHLAEQKEQQSGKKLRCGRARSYNQAGVNPAPEGGPTTGQRVLGGFMVT